MQVAVIKYNAGNICSVLHALKRIGIEAVVTDSPEVIRSSDRVIFPGQGEAATTMHYLRESGLDRVILGLRQPVLGICIGQQLLCAESEEGYTRCLSLFDDVKVRRFRPEESEGTLLSGEKNLHTAWKVPHMGWNTIRDLSSPLFAGISEGAYVYFLHSFYVPCCQYAIATGDYCQSFSAALHKDNFYATQFHPEKSGRVGERILKNFIDLCHD